jgi:serine/threonine protein kinase
VPRVEGFSDEFNDLISKLMEKDPIKRINWDELKAHDFWQESKTLITAPGTRNYYNKTYEFTKRLYPIQPQFDMYLQSRGIIPQHFYD